MKLLLNPLASQQFEAFSDNPPQSVLLIAPDGSGKETILRALADRILGQKPIGRLLEIKPEPDKKSISIDAIRDLKKILMLKSNLSRVILILNAANLSDAAQNSLLKIIEEPPQNTHFLLGVVMQNDLTETIRSRTTIWRLIPPTQAQLTTYFSNYPSAAVQKALAIGGSRTGLISSLLSDDVNHPLIQAIELSKKIMGENRFDRLMRVDVLAKDNQAVKALFEAMSLVCVAALENAAVKQTTSVERWERRLRDITLAQQQLSFNISSKLILDRLFMVI